MKKENDPKSERLELETKINSLTEVLKKHLKDVYDFECFMNAISADSEFIQELEAHRHDSIYDIQRISRNIKKHGTEEDVHFFETISDTFISGQILSGHIKNGNSMIYQMKGEFDDVIG